MTRPAEGPGTPQREMATLDRIRLTGLLKTAPAKAGAFHFRACPDRTSQKAPERYDRWMEQAVHDRGGWPTEAPIDRSEHELADWELLTDALVGALGRSGVMNVDELRRGIESMPPDEYEQASYYERWLYSMETILTEKGILARGELDARLDA